MKKRFLVGALLVLGAILAFSGINIPLGIGFMLVGAASLGTAIALNWNSIVEALRGPVGLITGIISGALLVLGAILLFTGVGIPLGLGLMLAGAAGLGTVVAVNWDFLVDKVKGIWESIKKFWNTYIAPVFTAKWWINLGKTCINGLISGFEGGINGIIGAVTMASILLAKRSAVAASRASRADFPASGVGCPSSTFGSSAEVLTMLILCGLTSSAERATLIV